MNKKQCFTIVIFLLASFNITVCANTYDRWDYIIKPTSFNDIEQMFVDKNCPFSFPSAYIYNTQSERFLLQNESQRLYPENSEIFGHCNALGSVPKQYLQMIFHKQINPNDKQVLIYFDVPYDPDTGQDLSFTDEWKEHAKSNLKSAASITTITKYLIRTPINGIKL